MVSTGAVLLEAGAKAQSCPYCPYCPRAEVAEAACAVHCTHYRFRAALPVRPTPGRRCFDVVADPQAGPAETTERQRFGDRNLSHAPLVLEARTRCGLTAANNRDSKASATSSTSAQMRAPLLLLLLLCVAHLRSSSGVAQAEAVGCARRRSPLQLGETTGARRQRRRQQQQRWRSGRGDGAAAEMVAMTVPLFKCPCDPFFRRVLHVLLLHFPATALHLRCTRSRRQTVTRDLSSCRLTYTCTVHVPCTPVFLSSTYGQTVLVRRCTVQS